MTSIFMVVCIYATNVVLSEASKLCKYIFFFLKKGKEMKFYETENTLKAIYSVQHLSHFSKARHKNSFVHINAHRGVAAFWCMRKGK